MLPTIEIVQGDDVYLDLPVEVDGVPADITSWQFWLTAKASADDTDQSAIFQCSSAVGSIVPFDAAGGIARAHVLPAQTKTQPPGLYIADAQAKQPAGAIVTVYRGFFRILPEITRA